MVRPIYAHEMCDPDFSWLINTFRESNPEYVAVESSCLPVILINFSPVEGKEDFVRSSFEEIPPDEPVHEAAEKEPHKRP